MFIGYSDLLFKIVFYAFFISSSFSALASKEQCDKSLSLGVGQSWPPFIVRNNQGISGLDIELTELIFKKANLCFTTYDLPSSARGLSELKKGQIDFLTAASYSDERSKIGLYSNAYRSESMRIFYLANNHAIAKLSLEQMFALKYTVAINNGAYYGKLFEHLKTIPSYAQQIVEVATLEQRMRMLQQGHVDFVIDDLQSGLHFIKANPKSDLSIQIHDFKVHDNPIYFILSKASTTQQDIDKINRAIDELKAQIERRLQPYMASSNEQQ